MMLDALAGAWSGAETLSPAPWSPGGPATGRHVFAPATGGTTLVQDYVEHRDGAIALTGHGVWCAEPEGDGVLWWWFDSLGFPPAGPSRGAWEGDTLVMVKASPRGVQRATFALGGDVLEHRIEARLGDATEFTTLVVASYAREATAVPARTIDAASTAQTAPAPRNASSTSAA